MRYRLYQTISYVFISLKTEFLTDISSGEGVLCHSPEQIHRPRHSHPPTSSEAPPQKNLKNNETKLQKKTKFTNNETSLLETMKQKRKTN